MSEKLVSSTQGSHDSTHEGDAQVIPVFDIQEELKKLPDRPGVYIMHDAKDAIIYVGKAINLKRRVHQYFVRKIGRGPKIERMVEQIARFEYIVTDSELEALVLENNLIKEHRPKYNTLLKDDKTYPYIRVTVEEEYPRVQFTRKMKKDKSRYFGPFKSAWAVRDTIDLLRKLYKIRDCSRVLPRDIGQERPCLNYQIGQCDAPCQGQIGKEAYRENVDRALDFLNGNYTPVLKMLEEKMQKASEELNFEDAASYRDLRESVLQVSQKQKIDRCPEHASGRIAATEQTLEPRPVQPVMGDKQTQHQRSGDFMESLPDEGISHQHRQQHDHSRVNEHALVFHLRSPAPQASC